MTVDRVEFANARPRDVALLRALFSEGRELTKTIALDRWHIGGRQFRAAVSELRRQGVPIVSRSAAGSVYRMARSEDEVEEFVKSELLSRATDLLHQAHEIRGHARSFFEPIQPELIASKR